MRSSVECEVDARVGAEVVRGRDFVVQMQYKQERCESWGGQKSRYFGLAGGGQAKMP